MDSASWTSLIPPLTAIILAIVSRQVILALGAGLWIGYWLLSGSVLGGLADALDGAIAVLSNPGDAKVILFALIIGAMLAVIGRLGGVAGFTALLDRRQWLRNGKQAQWFAWGTGIVIFIESNLTLLVAGSLSRPLFDRFRISREKLAYLIDSTSAPICILIPLNAWGAFNLGLLEGTGVDNAITTFVYAIPLNFYALLAVLLAALSIAFNWRIGPMRTAEARAAAAPSPAPSNQPPPDETSPSRMRAWFMLLPIVVLIMVMPMGLYITGDGVFSDGSGSTSVLWAVLAGLTTAWVMALLSGSLDIDELMKTSLQGAGELLPVAVILLLALALGDLSDLLGAGRFIAQATNENVPHFLLPLLIFLTAAAAAFSIGSSWGLFAIMIPIAMPIAMALDLNPSLLLAAVLSGAVFGDHASPVSDTTIVASLAADTDHIAHVRTQLPYALTAGGLAALGFLIAGFWAS